MSSKLLDLIEATDLTGATIYVVQDGVDKQAPTSLINDIVDDGLAGKQPLDSDLTAIAALTTTGFGRSLLTSVSAKALRASLGTGVLAGFYNKIINGNFDFWQRTTSLVIAAGANAYVADRWNIRNTTNQPVTVTRYTMSAGDRAAVDGAPLYGLQAQFSSAPSSGQLILRQYIEDVTTLDAGPATMFCHGASSISGSAAILHALTQNFGSGGSGNVTAFTGSVAVGGGFTEARLVGTIPSTTSKTIGAGSCLIAEWYVEPRATGSVYFARVGIVPGDASEEPDPFSPRHPQQELALCERYYQTPAIVVGTVVLSGTFVNQVLLPTPMRVVPTVGAPTFNIGTGATFTSTTERLRQDAAHSTLATATSIPLDAEF